MPVTVGADWLASAWDQNGAMYVMSPAVAVLEDIVAGWLRRAAAAATRRLGRLRHRLPHGELHVPGGGASRGAAAGGLERRGARAAARATGHRVRRRRGARLGGGRAAPARVRHRRARAHRAWTNRGACAPRRSRNAMADGRGPGHRLRASRQRQHRRQRPHRPHRRHRARARGVGARRWRIRALGGRGARAERPGGRGWSSADSWATDAHKWLNVPYDSGLAIVADPAPHRAAMGLRASYLQRGDDEERVGMDWVPESSRRSRVIPTLRAAAVPSAPAASATSCSRTCAARAANGRATGRGVPASASSTTWSSTRCWCSSTAWAGGGLPTRPPGP